jgi:outer membrane lipoprotein-sorting protein
MPSRLRFAIALLVVATALGVGCQKEIPPPDNAIEQPSELRSAVQARTDDFEEARYKEVVLDYFGEDNRVKVRQLILVAQPDKLRVQTRLPGSNEIVSLLVTNGEKFALHRRENNIFLTGPPTRKNINRLLPVDLSARDVVRIMFGGAPWNRFDRAPGDPKLEWNTDIGRYVYSVETADGGRLEMEVRHPTHSVVSVVEHDNDGELVYRYTTDDWRRYGRSQLPDWRRFVWPARDLDFSLDVEETELDVGLSDNLFEMSPPPGSNVRRVDGEMETIRQRNSDEDAASSPN